MQKINIYLFSNSIKYICINLIIILQHSLYNKNKTICLDGDGSLLMHMGSLLTAGKFASKNFKHILLNNNSHESVGGQKTYIEKLNLKNIVKNFIQVKN